MWDRFGNVDSYVEPFFGSGAVLLGRPHQAGTETVNDIDAFISNFWRALANDPEQVALHADWPVNEADLHARHLWLVNREEFREKMKTDPEYFDAKIAGWWCWGISQWIGSGWCSRPDWTGRTNAANFPRGMGAKRVHRQRPHCSGQSDGMGVHRQMPELDHAKGGRATAQQVLRLTGQQGVHRKMPELGSDRGVRVPHLSDDGAGVHAKRPNLSGHGSGNGVHGEEIQSGLYSYMYELAARLRHVRVCCGDWKRITGPSVTIKHGVCGIFLDPPYDMRIVSNKASGRDGHAGSDALYGDHSNDVSKEVREWALENGGNPLLRIALCGYEGEHDMPSDWECVAWKAHGDFASQGNTGNRDNAGRERIWFNRSCISVGPLFANLCDSE